MACTPASSRSAARSSTRAGSPVPASSVPSGSVTGHRRLRRGHAALTVRSRTGQPDADDAPLLDLELQVDAVELDAPGGGVVEAHEQADERRLAGAGRA